MYRQTYTMKPITNTYDGGRGGDVCEWRRGNKKAEDQRNSDKIPVRPWEGLQLAEWLEHCTLNHKASHLFEPNYGRFEFCEKVCHFTSRKSVVFTPVHLQLGFLLHQYKLEAII